MVLATGRLLEREAELDRIAELLDAAREGSGALVVVTGPAGIGKTRLVRAARVEAEERGARVLAARGAELERDYAFGVARQWFERPVRTDTEAGLLNGAAALAAPVVLGTDAEASDAFASLHGLYWLCANLADRAPLVLLLDDAQWSDEASLRFLAFLSRRLEELPLLAIATARPPLEGVVADLAADPAVQTLALRALAPQAVAAFLRDRAAGARVDPEFATVCHHVTGGNPFLLSELAHTLADEGVPYTAAAARSVPAIGPASVGRAILARLSRLPPGAERLARAVAVLGDDADLVVAATLVELEEDDAAAVADALARADIFDDVRPLRFVHPVVRAAVHDALSSGERERLHARAAELLARRGAGTEAVAVHLLATSPRGDETTVELLADAARASLARGAPEVAASLLERALAEPADAELRPRLLLELGRAEHLLERPSAVGRLREAHSLAADPEQRARAALTLAWAVGPRVDEQAALVPVLDEAVAALSGSNRELELELEAARLNTAWVDPSLTNEIAPRAERYAALEGRTPAECLLLAYLARIRMDLGRPASEVGLLAERAASPAVVAQIAPDSIALLHTGVVLRHAERFEPAIRLLDAAIVEAQARGSLRGFVMASMFRSAVVHRTGDVRNAEADARSALDAATSRTWFHLPAVAVLVDALIEQARLDEADALLEEHALVGDLPDMRPSPVLLFSRSWLRHEQGDLAAALADLTDARRRLDRSGHLNIAGLDGRVRTALIQLARGDDAAARDAATTAMAVARSWGTPGALGTALRAQALVDREADLLREAADHLARSPLRLEHARTLLDLGSALRRAGARSAAREPLREALALSDECGGILVRERAREELAATGMRVRREPVRGAAALTPSERRIADRAAAGASNPEIAQALFVTVKTVEMHLSNAYRKLEISSRRELERALRS